MIPFLLSLPAHHQIPPQDEMGALLLRARTTRNASKWEESIQAYDAMLLKDPFHETALVERATTLSWAKRYDESIAAWRVVKEKVPNRSREAEDNIAKVAAWSRQFALALETLAPYVREGQRQAVLDSATYLSWDRRYPESLERIGGWLKAHPDDTDALLIQARILSWSGQLAASRSAYERLLKLHPGHPDALGGLARVSVWSGDAAGARVYVDQLPAEELKKPENQTLLAQVELAEGHRSRAKARLRPLAAVGSSVRADAEELLRAAAQAQGPSAELFQARTDSNEGLTFQDTGALARVPLGDGSLELGGLRHRSEFNGLESTVNETSLGLAYPLGSVRVSGGVQHFTGFEGDAANGHRLALTWLIGKGLELHLSQGRTFITLTPQAVAKRVGLQTYEAIFQLTKPSHLFNLTAGGAEVSAGNRRKQWSASYDHRWRVAPFSFTLGLATRSLDYDKSLDLGFFNPERYRYHSASGGLQLERGGFFGGLEAHTGRQQVNQQDWKTAWGYGLNCAWRRGPFTFLANWSEAVAGLPVVNSLAPDHYKEHSLRFGLRLTGPWR